MSDFETTPPPRKKLPSFKRRVMVSDDEADDMDMNDREADMDVDVDMDPDMGSQRGPKRASKASSSSSLPPKRRRTDDESEEEFDSGAYGDENVDDDEDFIDDDEDAPKRSKKKGGSSKSSKPQASATTKRPRRGKSRDEESFVDVVGTSTTPQPDAPAPLPKKKLPTIRKIKQPGVGDGSSNKSTPATTPQHDLALGTAPLRKLPGERPDINLNDSAIYNDLFKPSGNTRTSASKAKEDKKRELHRMRDEAKAKRAAEAGPTFNLQAQCEKILRFEERLRKQRSGALYPNCLGAKWKEEYERQAYTRHMAVLEAEREEGEVGGR